ncbi:MAG TPA: 2-amino-4-hydroxy-6-hydroxymethyldihydropteridine diphosphokinase [Steroidobacteraceae bacterium]|jgi:2-amino-4-hydroxy-6-hydroxymethyldihydropteridine diphosphokinase
MVDVYVAAGSNVDAVRNLQSALALLQEVYAPLRISHAYRNKAVGFSGEDFVNLVVGFSTDDSVAEVRRQTQRIEARCGRPPDAPKWAPRTMDLDILLYGQLISDEPRLILPRPDLVRRPYMLKPMVDIAPLLVHPTQHKTMRELWDAFDAQGHEMTEVELGRGVSGES